MGDCEDIKKLNAFLIAEYQNDIQQELDAFLDKDCSDESNAEDSDTEDYAGEIENDLQESEKVYEILQNLNITLPPEETTNDSTFLKANEQQEINSCVDGTLRRLMTLNRKKCLHLKELYNKICELLKECHHSIIKEKQNEFKRKCSNQKVCQKRFVWKLGYPYFKDESFFSCPQNSDVIEKKRNKEYSLSYPPIIKRWTEDDRIVLKTAVRVNYCHHKVQKLKQKICILSSKIKLEKDEDQKRLIEQLCKAEKEMSALSSSKEWDYPGLDNSNIIEWWKISTDELKGKHSASECRAFWNLYLHPAINKNNWSEEENSMIVNLAVQYKNQNWDLIAEKLNTNRTGFLTCVHYHSKLCDKFKRERFLPEEDEYLEEVIKLCRIGNFIPWSKVAYYFEHRSRTQLYHRYIFYLNEQDMVKGTFTDAEDILLLCLINKFGRDYTTCAQYMPTRTSIQMRNRYSNYLGKLTINRGNWTPAEDEQIMDYVAKYGDKNWTGLAEELARTRAHVRQRYWVIAKWIDKHHTNDISKMPRRNHAYLSSLYGQQHYKVKQAEKFMAMNTIPTLKMIEGSLEDNLPCNKKKPIKQSTNIHFVESQLIEFFKTSCKLYRQPKPASSNIMQKSANEVKIVLNLLDAKLELPNDDELETNTLLNASDVAILKCIKNCSNEMPTTSKYNMMLHSAAAASSTPSTADNIDFKMSEIIAPNIDTLLGLRNLLLKHKTYKSQCENNFASYTCKDKIVEKNSLNAVNPKYIEAHKDMFMQRFYSLFKWPCIMSVLEPNDNLLVPNLISNDKDSTSTPCKSAGRPKKSNSGKISRMNFARLTKLKKKLDTLRDKQVLQSENTNKNPSSCLNSHVRKERTAANTSTTSKTSSSRMVSKFAQICLIKNTTENLNEKDKLLVKSSSMCQGDFLGFNEKESVDNINENKKANFRLTNIINNLQMNIEKNKMQVNLSNLEKNGEAKIDDPLEVSLETNNQSDITEDLKGFQSCKTTHANVKRRISSSRSQPICLQNYLRNCDNNVDNQICGKSNFGSEENFVALHSNTKITTKIKNLEASDFKGFETCETSYSNLRGCIDNLELEIINLQNYLTDHSVNNKIWIKHNFATDNLDSNIVSDIVTLNNIIINKSQNDNCNENYVDDEIEKDILAMQN